MKRIWLQPNLETNQCIQNISINYLIQKEIKALLLDVDGTLLSRNQKKLNKPIKDWIYEAKKHLKLHLLSNNPSRERVASIASELNLNFTYRALKPRKKATIEALNQFNLEKSNIAIIGDKRFTDILIGNRLGIYTILVKPVQKDGLPSKNNYYQKFEKYFIRFFGGG